MEGAPRNFIEPPFSTFISEAFYPQSQLHNLLVMLLKTLVAFEANLEGMVRKIFSLFLTVSTLAVFAPLVGETRSVG